MKARILAKLIAADVPTVSNARTLTRLLHGTRLADRRYSQPTGIDNSNVGR